MPESPTWRRRLASIGVLLLSATALIATSAPPIPQATLTASLAGSAELTASAPRVLGRVTLDLSAAALPAPTTGQLRVSGTVSFATTLQGFRIDVHPVGIATPSPVARQSPGPAQATLPSDGTTTWSIEQLCRNGEPCRREFEVTLELISPQPGETRTVSFQANVQIIYVEVDAKPDGATASWFASPEFSPVPDRS